MATLEKTDLSDDAKRETREVLTMEYTSSDESEREQNSDSEERMEVTKYVVKKLRWQRTKLTNIKTTLDNLHIRSLSKRTRRMRVPRVIGKAVSTRPLPENTVEWAVRMPVEARQALFRQSQANTSSNSSLLNANNSVTATSTPIGAQRQGQRPNKAN